MPTDKPTPATQDSKLILTINGGSSSIKYAAFSDTTPPKRILNGQVERLGSLDVAVQTILGDLRGRLDPAAISGIGHRIVHGGVSLVEHRILTPEVMAKLREARELDLAHLPREIALIEAFEKAFPSVRQVACFDTAFCRDLPRVTQLLPIPRRYFNAGVRRLGFHGLSYTYLIRRLAEAGGTDAANGRVILSHLGSGASMVAVKGGKPIDTTMAFTPTAGLMMGTRPGDIDPGLLVYLMREQKLSALEMDHFISSQCGLLGVSETSSDMRDLLARGEADQRAVEAVALFCYQAKKFIGSLFAALGGLDTLVFSGGIGEHSPEARAGICQGLDCLGIGIDSQRNAKGEDIVSSELSRVTVRVIPTDEEVVIAETVRRFITSDSESHRVKST